MHRRRLLADVQTRTGVDPRESVLALQQDIELIEAGLTQFDQDGSTTDRALEPPVHAGQPAVRPA